MAGEVVPPIPHKHPQGFSTWVEVRRTELDDLRAENLRLRETLTALSDAVNEVGIQGDVEAFFKVVFMARAVLAGENPQ